ncbi:hypothetical protein ES702_04531 [subsurface metagenome]
MKEEERILLFEAVKKADGALYLRVVKKIPYPYNSCSCSWGMSQTFWEMVAWEFEKISESSDSDGAQKIEARRIIKLIREGFKTMKEEKASEK